MLLTSITAMMVASPGMPAKKKGKKQRASDSTAVTVGDSVFVDTLGNEISMEEGDTMRMDSLQKAVWKHNQVIDDSIRLDSIQRKKSGGVDAPVNYTATDSLVYDAHNKVAHLYGNSNVKYQNMDLTSDRIAMDMDKSNVSAVGTADSTAENGIKGKPIFKMGSDTYDTDTIKFNFKSKKALINNVYTAQQDGFLTGTRSKRDSSGVIYLQHGRYTTCDDPHPDFYLSLSRAKVRPGKDVVFGPTYLVVADVPMPFAIPYGFFPFTKSYSSGFIMPTYGDENTRGFYLRDGGYYFAMSDKWDLKLLGEIYTKGSWGISAASNYRKRYRYSGSFFFSYQDSRTGEKGMPDFTKQESFKVQWSHRQDSKANPYSSLSASVNFATSSYERNNLTSLYNPQSLTQSTRTSSVSWSTSFSSIGMTLSSTANLTQNMRDSSIAMTLPDLNISISSFYPFRRKKAVGKERWYEKINMSYTGHISNSISTTESKFMGSNLIKDWRNGWEHSVPIKATFSLFNVLTVTPSVTFKDRMYANKINQSWDEKNQKVVTDTVYGFYNAYEWNSSLSLSTKLYGFWTPSRKIFGDKIQTIRHVFTPEVSISYRPDFGAPSYGFWDTYQQTDANGNVSLATYSHFDNALFGGTSSGKSGTLNFSLKNNLEMKMKSDKDSTGFKKISLIDAFDIGMSYNMAAKVRPWSDMTMKINLKWWKNYTFNLNAVFKTYGYEIDDNGNITQSYRTEWSRGRFGIFQGMSQNFSYTLNPEKLRKLFGGGDDSEDDKKMGKGKSDSDDDDENDVDTNIDKDMEKGKSGAKKTGKAQTDEDGYMAFSMPWSLTFGYGITMRENTDKEKFNKNTMRYPYKFTQTLNVSGNLRISDGWNISFSSGYDFDNHKLSMTTASLQRDLHCFSMSCSVVLAPYTSYNFSFRCNAATLTDALKYDKRSGYSNAVQWY